MCIGSYFTPIVITVFAYTSLLVANNQPFKNLHYTLTLETAILIKAEYCFAFCARIFSTCSKRVICITPMAEHLNVPFARDRLALLYPGFLHTYFILQLWRKKWGLLTISSPKLLGLGFFFTLFLCSRRFLLLFECSLLPRLHSPALGVRGVCQH